MEGWYPRSLVDPSVHRDTGWEGSGGDPNLILGPTSGPQLGYTLTQIGRSWSMVSMCPGDIFL